MTITEFAESVGASAASVTRLCRSVGIEKFSRLRMELALAAERSAAGPVNGVSGDITSRTPLPDLVTSLSELGARSMEETSKLLDQDSLAAVAKTLGEASHVYTIGSGSTHMAAVYLEHKLRSLSIPATSLSDPPSAVIGLTAARPGDVLIAVSQAGSAHEAVPPLAEAKRRGCTTVLISRHGKSPAADFADHTFLAVQDAVQLRTGTLSSRIAEVFIADCLISSVVVRHHRRASNALTSVEDALERYW